MESDETNMPPFIGLARPLSAQAEAMPAQEVIGERCIDGGKCHHRCESKCFRRECCGPLSGYTGPWKYEEMPAQEPVAKVQNNSGIAWLPAGYNDLSIGPGALLYTAPPDLAARVKELEAVLRDAVTLVSIINQSEIVRSGYSLSLERAFRAALAKEKT